MLRGRASFKNWASLCLNGVLVVIPLGIAAAAQRGWTTLCSFGSSVEPYSGHRIGQKPSSQCVAYSIYCVWCRPTRMYVCANIKIQTATSTHTHTHTHTHSHTHTHTHTHAHAHAHTHIHTHTHTPCKCKCAIFL